MEPMDTSRMNAIPRVKDQLVDQVQKLFTKFLIEYSPQDTPKYQADALSLKLPEKNTLFVDFADIQEFDQNLASLLLAEFYRFYPALVKALYVYTREAMTANFEAAEATQAINVLQAKELYVGFYNLSSRLKVRELSAAKTGTLVRICGQVVRTHGVHPELISGTFECVDCGTVLSDIEQQFKFTQPTVCRNNACNNRSRFKLLLHRSRFVDFQRVRIQETQSELPRGAIPRSFDVIIRGADQVEKIQAGDRCDFIGTIIVVPDIASMMAANGGQVRQDTATGDGIGGLKILGVREMSHKLAFLANCVVKDGSVRPIVLEKSLETMESTAQVESLFTDKEIEKIGIMRRDKKLLDNITKCLFPSIYGNEEIKRGITLQLFGGVHKTTGEGTSLRGDINICIVGDPSTAKSQFLKAVADMAPTRAIYTSGKASTASGLTAAVVRDEDGGFVIEAGALMLADEGICCIDEFDKMDVKDQVAIHEAMEQQTISITKAGVKATLNARTSVLAAANPIGGHYDRSKSLRMNLSLSLPIMSRFDLFFILLDDCNELTDLAIARRILDMHAGNELEESHSTYSLHEIKTYIKFARLFKPKLSKEAEKDLVIAYKKLRLEGIGSVGNSGFGSNNKNSWRITVRQLESLVRLSEAMAKLYCEEEVSSQHVAEATKLLSNSVVKIERPDIDLNEEEEERPSSQADRMETDAPATPAPSSATTQGMKMTFEEYKGMVDVFVTKLRAEEEKIDSGEGEGMKREELINWYLDHIEDQLEDEAELIKAKLKCEKVVDRLIHVDHILIPLKTVSTQEDEDAVLVINPNYAPDDF